MFVKQEIVCTCMSVLRLCVIGVSMHFYFHIFQIHSHIPLGLELFKKNKTKQNTNHCHRTEQCMLDLPV